MTNGILCTVIDNGYKWLQFAPENLNYVATAMFDEKNILVKWYIDVVKSIGQENGRFFYDDLYIDVGYVPGKEPELLDEDELIEAFHSGLISQDDCDLANRIGKIIVEEIKSESNYIINNFNHYFDEIKKKIG